MHRTGESPEPISPWAIDTYLDCPSRLWFADHPRPNGKIETEEAAANISIALHDAVMRIGRQTSIWRQRGQMPSLPALRSALSREIANALFRKRVEEQHPLARERLAQAKTGIEDLASLIIQETDEWCINNRTGAPLVWLEQYLDSGERYTGVEILPGYIGTTRADLIGLRAGPDGVARVVIRDYKAKRQSVNPRFDNGILMRAIWAAGEVSNPRCPWFLLECDIEVDPGVIEIEAVNLLHGGTGEFLQFAEVSTSELQRHRERFSQLMGEIRHLRRAASVDDAQANPGTLCKDYCDYLHRCDPGQHYVRDSFGSMAVNARLKARRY